MTFLAAIYSHRPTYKNGRHTSTLHVLKALRSDNRTVEVSLETEPGKNVTAKLNRMAKEL